MSGPPYLSRLRIARNPQVAALALVQIAVQQQNQHRQQSNDAKQAVGQQ